MLLIIALHYKYCSAQLMLTKKIFSETKKHSAELLLSPTTDALSQRVAFCGPDLCTCVSPVAFAGQIYMKQVWTAQAATNLRLVITSLPFLKWQNTDNAQHQQQHNLRCA